MRENELLEVQELLAENLFDTALNELGFQIVSAAVDDTVFKSSTSIMYKLYKNGVLDTAECGDFNDLAELARAIPRMVEYLVINQNSNINEHSLSLISDIAKSMQLYLALYERENISIAENILPRHGPKDLSLIAAALKIQPNTLRNIISTSELNAFTLDELKVWLEKQERFMQYNKISSVTLEQPFDFSFIRNADGMLHVLKSRCELMGNSVVWKEFEAKHCPNGLGSANAFFSDGTFRMERLYKIFAAANLKPETIKKGLLNVKNDIKSNLDTKFLSIEMNFPQYLPQTEQDKAADKTFNSKELKTLLKNQFDFEVHPSDRGRNKKMSGMQKREISLAIENLKTPQVWVNENNINVDMLEGLTITQYVATSDGTGRHSGLRLYTELAREQVLKIKIDSIDSLNQFLNALSKNEPKLIRGE